MKEQITFQKSKDGSYYHAYRGMEGITVINITTNPYDRKNVYWVFDHQDNKIRYFAYIKDAKQFVRENY